MKSIESHFAFRCGHGHVRVEKRTIFELNLRPGLDDFGKLMASVKKEDISGQVTRSAPGKTDDVETYELEVELSDMMPGLPPDANVEKSMIKVPLTGEFPVDPALRPLSKKQSMSMTGMIAMNGPNGEAIKLSMDMEKSTRIVKTPKQP